MLVKSHAKAGSKPRRSRRARRRLEDPAPQPKVPSRLFVNDLRPNSQDPLDITLVAEPGQSARDLFSRLSHIAEDRAVQVASVIAIGAADLGRDVLEGLPAIAGAVHWPILWIDGSPDGAPGLVGLQAMAVRNAAVRPLLQDGRTVGCVVDEPSARRVFLAGVIPADTAAPEAEQAHSVFERMRALLAGAGLEFPHVVRTWLYLDRILDWYGDFNRVRREFFKETRVSPTHPPASTGIGAANPHGAALAAGALAVLPHDAGASIEYVPSPRQGPALAYGSAFSRAAEITTPGERRIFISGTASIDPEGNTVYRDDFLKQTDLTMEVVRAILDSRGFDMADISRVTAYIRNPSDLPKWRAWLARHGWSSAPVLTSVNTVCRDDLLVEVELDAVH